MWNIFKNKQNTHTQTHTHTHTHTHTRIQRTDWSLPEGKGSGEKTKWIKRVYGDGLKLDFFGGEHFAMHKVVKLLCCTHIINQY